MLRTNQHGCKSLLVFVQKFKIKDMITSQQGLKTNEIREKFQRNGSHTTVGRAVIIIGFSNKKKTLYAYE